MEKAAEASAETKPTSRWNRRKRGPEPANLPGSQDPASANATTFIESDGVAAVPAPPHSSAAAPSDPLAAGWEVAPAAGAEAAAMTPSDWLGPLPDEEARAEVEEKGPRPPGSTMPTGAQRPAAQRGRFQAKKKDDDGQAGDPWPVGDEIYSYASDSLGPTPDPEDHQEARAKGSWANVWDGLDADGPEEGQDPTFPDADIEVALHRQLRRPVR